MDNPALGENTRVGGQGDSVVLLVKGDAYWEVLQKVGDRAIIMSPLAYREASVSEMEADGYVGVVAIKTIKANGTWMYCVDAPVGVTWYIAGKRLPPKPKREIKL